MATDHNPRPMSRAWQRHRAARTVACQAHDAEDLALLLDMLGLTASEGRVSPEVSTPEPPVPEPRTPPPTLDPMSACRLSNLLRDGKAGQAGRPASPG
ncbi:hypothetical protein [Actinophytocola oryzae]|uniref:Uncharacterized protein n=1 Tax=Actinophytocola oryzae TaxID=502181 RepID=A0A4V3FRM5_9PSEU|nr:hypothetical protein [Actinophytocola oryzae]TDV44101.1 hypothetical protein CLV71_11410 [Actinophytocola oryzae]